MVKPEFLEHLLDEMAGDPHMGPILNLAYPRRIAAPNGYLSPRYYAAVSASSIFNSLHATQTVDFVKSCIFFVTRKLTMFHVPTFFVGHEFAEAIAETDIEDDVKASDIQWPDEAMLFCIPEKFSMEFFGTYIPFIALAHYSVKDIQAMPGVKLTVDGKVSEDPSKVTAHTFVHFQWANEPNGPFMDYVSSWPDYFTMGEVSRRLKTGTISVSAEEEKLLAEGKITHVGMTDDQREHDLMEKVREFSAKLLLAMFDEPQFIGHGHLARKLKVRNGKVLQTELWNPNMLGGNYKHPVAEGTGTHASPKLHRRRGHRRRQWYGPGNTLWYSLRVWPKWINAKTK